MGNEESSLADDSTPPATLSARTLPALADYITKSGTCKKIVIMSGAGISTSAGIPDFRSPDTGLYANLARLDLPYAEAVFDISYFRRNPHPFYTLAQELYPGRFRPTVAHAFIRLLADRGLLLKHFTQNIDCLDREAGVPEELIVEAHGSFARQSCIECRRAFPHDEMLRHVQAATVPRCLNETCGGLVKPEIVFFGEALPNEFFAHAMLPREADLVIVMGTSLTVQPFANLPRAAGRGTPRLLINLEQVGGLGGREDDVLLLGDCDEGVRKLAKACGWSEELERIWRETGRKFGAEDDSTEEVEESEKTREEKDAALEDEVDKLAADVDKTLKLSKDHSERERTDLKFQVKKDLTEPDKGDGQGLTHVFPHLKKDSSL
ncbi:hypothetical protein FH972_023120 [Carpinus fangiana]|uniref:NAD-dependent protein deacetylase n=1 Tax=Carpinus fangiana TaxID=176857 RepID=A0A5N6KUV0_9ROSI|nr:hypothetical protein FH972_023120 [Carpinus fangiana]